MFADTLLQNLATTTRIFAGLILWLLVFADLVLESFLYLSSFLWGIGTMITDINPLLWCYLIELIALVFINGLKSRNKCKVASMTYFYFPTGLLLGEYLYG
ncbi:MAG: hypothetical protein HC799_19200 [Limnothrix sp. RL_2_0]|nr:hypothetical protein [Limnothrix sp. RL_2_0]